MRASHWVQRHCSACQVLRNESNATDYLLGRKLFELGGYSAILRKYSPSLTGLALRRLHMAVMKGVSLHSMPIPFREVSLLYEGARFTSNFSQSTVPSLTCSEIVQAQVQKMVNEIQIQIGAAQHKALVETKTVSNRLLSRLVHGSPRIGSFQSESGNSNNRTTSDSGAYWRYELFVAICFIFSPLNFQPQRLATGVFLPIGEGLEECE